MLLDFVFNLGTTKKFPKFTKGVLDNDVEVILSEYKRFYNDTDTHELKELRYRNEMFYQTYLEGLE